MIGGGKVSPLRDTLFASTFIGSIFGLLTWLTWRRWPDILVDFGSQLYMPWQISTGAVMERDFHYLAGGPLSQHYHALLFKIFGVSFLTLIVSNLVVLALMLTAIYLCLRRCSDQLTAITACVSVLVVFAFAHYSTLGIFNYITPYSEEVVHGLLLSIMAIVLLVRWFETENPWLACAAGFCAGLTLLTKPDLFLALALTFNFALALFWQVKGKGAILGRALALMVGAGLIPAASFFLWFLRVETVRQSVGSVLAAWIPLLTTSTARSPFYAWGMGLDKPWFHLQQTIVQSLGLAVLVALSVLVSWRRIPWRTAVLLTIALAIVLIQDSWEFNWFQCGYCLPTVCLALLALLILRERKTGWDSPVVFATLWAVWSLAVMAKLGVFCRIWHYGFALAMPAFVSGIYFLLWALPRALGRGGVVRPGLFRFLLWLLLLPGLVKLTKTSFNLYAHKTMPVASGEDTIMAYSPHYRKLDGDVDTALRWLENNVPPGATMTVLPQGAMLNYLSRHANPCGYSDWNPTQMAAFGQQKMTDALIAHSPDYLIELYIDYKEFDEPVFGLEKRFGLEAQQWIDAHYQPACPIIGHDWIKDGKFGIKILKQNPSPVTAMNSLQEGKSR